MAKKKKGTPPWVDKLLNFQSEISEEEYRGYWKRLNKVRKDRAAWNEEGQRIISELERREKSERPLFRGRDYRSVGEAKRAAQVFQSDHGGRVVRRDSRGRFSTKGRTFQVIGGHK